MVGDTDRGDVKPGAPSGWWDFMFRVAMNGQFGISSKVLEWPPELRARARENVALYKRVRRTIATGNTYHLTPPPAAEKPTGWMAIQYGSGDRSVVTAYRLPRSAARETFRLRGLRREAVYEVLRDGRPSGRLTGADLMGRGLPVTLGDEWRAEIVELTAR
jgi:alpha-galactosidase